MKPKNEFQRKIVALSEKLEPITEQQKQWAKENLFGNHFVNVRNRNNCLQCGHKWKSDYSLFADKIIKPTCPCCGAEDMEHIDHWETDERLYEYWAIIDVVEDLQVVRMFKHTKHMKRKNPAHHWNQEVIQHWVDQEGNTESLTAKCQSMGAYYVDQWIAGSPLEPRTKSRNHELRCGLSPFKILPGRETLPVIRRNGYKGYFYGEAPHEVFEAILTYPKAETLLKAKQRSLFKVCVGSGNNLRSKIENYWPSICIVMRNEYIVNDARDWFDHLRLLEHYGKDLRNPKYICPDNFHQEHQRLSAKYREEQKKIREENRRKAEIKRLKEKKLYEKIKKQYFGLSFSSGPLEISVLESVDDIVELGEKLHHCLNAKYAEKPKSLIMGAYVDGEPVEAIEFDLANMEIIQARGLQNKSSKYHDQILKAVRKNIHQIAKAQRSGKQQRTYKEVA